MSCSRTGVRQLVLSGRRKRRTLQNGVRIVTTFLTLVLLSTAGIAQPVSPSLTPVQRVVEMYQDGRFEEAELEALRMLSRPAGMTNLEMSELHRILAYISVARDDNEDAIEQFITALRLNPRLRVDRILTSPKILDIFDQAQDRLNRMSWEERESGERVIEIYRLRLEGGRRSLMLPGLGQFHKGQAVRGTLYSSAAGLAVIGLISSHIATETAGDKYESSNDPAELPDLYNDYRFAWRMRNGFLIGLAVVWSASILDAYLTPANLAESTSVSVSTVGDDGVGVSLSLIF